MADTLTPAQRSARMARIKSKDTKPELCIRRLLFSLGYRFRVSMRGLPGRPDIVFPRRRMVVFVHGCFWHAHAKCRIAHIPKTRSKYWRTKFAANRARDESSTSELRELGWETFVAWECETSDIDSLERRLVKFLGPPGLSKVA